jgi:hypothetical protein
VIPFLVVTSILNIALGYGLAIYLAKSSGSAPLHRQDSTGNSGAESFAGAGQRPVGLDTAWPAAAMAAAAGSAGHPAAVPTQATSESAAPAELPHEDIEVQSRTAAMEQDLLAGIEEFRNQLAQLKSKGSVSFDTPVAAS